MPKWKRNVLVIVIAGLAYAGFVHLTGLAVPCLFHRITGFQCPGCGITRMCLALLHLDFASAYRANPFVLVTSPILLWLLIASLQEKQHGRGYHAVSVLYACALVLFGIVRNLV